MDFFCFSFVFGAVLLILFFGLKHCYNILKIYSNFPSLHVFPILFAYYVSRKVPKDFPFGAYLFRTLTAKLQPHYKEGIVSAYLPRPTLMVFGEEPVKLFMNEKIASAKPPEYNIVKLLIGPGLIASSGKRWKKLRKMINPSFHLGVLKERVPLFNEHASVLIKDIETLVDKPSVDPLNMIKFHYLCSLSESVFGLKQCEEIKTALRNIFHQVDNLSALGIYMFAHPWLQFKMSRYISSTAKKFYQMLDEIDKFTKKVITEMKENFSSNETCNSEKFGINMQKSLTYILLQHHLNDPSFTIEDVLVEVKTFVAAGYDTVSYSTMWCLFMLGLYPEIQEKAFNEVNSVSGDYISYEECCKFNYLEAVIMETLRLYPTIPLFGRSTTEDVHLGKHLFPKGTNSIIFTYLWHRNPDMYPDPEKFDPERFCNEGIRHSWAHIPFAEGNRTCIGKKFALIEMKIFLAYILRKYKFISLDKREDVVLSWNVVLTPSKPLFWRILSRSKQSSLKKENKVDTYA